MVIKKQKFFLRFIEVVLDDQEALRMANENNLYDHINIISYNKLPLDDSFHLIRKKNAKIKIEPDIEKVFNVFDKTTKKHIKRTFKMEKLTFKMLDNNFDKTYQVYKEFEYANKRIPFVKSSLKGLLIFNAYDDHEIISSILCYDTHPSLKAHSIFSKRLKTRDKEKYKIISYATRRLIYEICKFAIKHHYSFFDLGSVNFREKEKAGITNFKLTFNPIIGEEYHYIYQSKKFLLAKRLKNIKILLFKFIKFDKI